MLKFMRRLLTLIAGIGFTLFGTGLSGLFFAMGVNTAIAILMVVVGLIFIVIQFVFDNILDLMEDKGS